MKIITVQPQKDFLTKIGKTNPCNALSEIIWNGFDANANNVKVLINRNELKSIKSIEIHDDGDGIDYTKLNEFFGKLGGSWKRGAKKQGDTILHGENGQGRFYAYTLGSKVLWKTKYKNGTDLFEYSIQGDFNDIEHFSSSEQRKTSGLSATTVVIENICQNIHFPLTETSQNLAKIFCIYLSKYPTKQLFLDGNQITSDLAQEFRKEYNLGDIELSSGSCITLKIVIIQWIFKSKRTIYFCDENGFTLDEMPLTNRISVVKKDFSIYIISDFFSTLKEETSLANGMDPENMEIVDIAIKKAKQYFAQKELLEKSKIIDKWVEEDIYPYRDLTYLNEIKKAEKQIFDILAVNVQSYLHQFDKQDKKNRKFTFQLLKQAIENNPESIQKIINEVLGLKKQEQEELAKLLNQTTLSSIIKSSQIVADRLNFLKGLEQLVFDNETKNILLERDQLHKILENEPWLFREDFYISATEESLEEVLRIHLSKLKDREDGLDNNSTVHLPTGKRGRIDLMFSKTRWLSEGETEHLIVELKRPSKKIDQEVLGQIKNYATAVSKDERFDKFNTKWIFIAVSNDIDSSVEMEVNQQNRPKGLVVDSPNLSIWVYTWAEIISQARSRLRLFSKQLNYNVTRSSANSYLSEVHGKFIPKFEKERVN